MTESLFIHEEKLQQLRHEWRRLPVLIDSLKTLEEILKTPNDYIIKTQLGETVNLADAIDDEHPLTSVTVIYQLPSQDQSPYGTPNVDHLTFLQVYLGLGKSIQPPQPQDFEPHLSLLWARVSDEKIIAEDMKQFMLHTKPSLIGTKIELVTITTKEGQRWAKDVIKMVEKNLPPKLFQTRCSLWTGITGEIDKSEATPFG